MERTKYLNAQEVKLLRSTTENRALRDKAAGRVGGVLNWMVVDTALSTGLRVSELARIRITDIDFDRSFINVHRLKRRKPVRDILAISPEFKLHLKEYIGKRTKGKLFIGKRGKLTAQGLQQIWNVAIKRAELPAKYTIHSARHTVAVHLLKRTKNLKQVQKQLGHTNINTTASQYCDVPFEDMVEGMKGLYEDNE